IDGPDRFIERSFYFLTIGMYVRSITLADWANLAYGCRSDLLPADQHACQYAPAEYWQVPYSRWVRSLDIQQSPGWRINVKSVRDNGKHLARDFQYPNARISRSQTESCLPGHRVRVQMLINRVQHPFDANLS